MGSQDHWRPVPSDSAGLDAYLIKGKPTPGAGHQVISSFWAGLRDARAVNDRHAETGAIETDRPPSWIGAIAYLCFIDQVGTVLRRPSRRAPDRMNGFLRALHYFAPQLSIEESEALYALRCSLAHNYSLSNPSERPLRRHIFLLWPSGAPLLQLPEIPWSGQYVGSSPEPNARTQVCLEAVGDLGEQVAASILECHADGDLAADERIGPAELHVRFAALRI